MENSKVWVTKPFVNMSPTRKETAKRDHNMTRGLHNYILGGKKETNFKGIRLLLILLLNKRKKMRDFLSWRHFWV